MSRSLHEILSLVSSEVHSELRRAVEIGRWADGSALSAEQRGQCLQVLIAWEAGNLPPEERTGYIDRGSKAEGGRCADDTPTQALRILPDGAAG